MKPLSPAVLSLVNRHSLDATLIPASGPKGHVLKGDVLAYLAGDPIIITKTTTTPLATSAKPTAGVGVGRPTKVKYTDVPATNIRKVIAKRLTESKTQIPHAYSTVDVDVTKMMACRKEVIEASGTKFSVNDVIIKSAALALRNVPEVNAWLNPQGEPEKLHTVDISIAVATDNGLITPIVTGADGR